jgi:hypothetical protein
MADVKFQNDPAKCAADRRPVIMRHKPTRKKKMRADMEKMRAPPMEQDPPQGPFGVRRYNPQTVRGHS